MRTCESAAAAPLSLKGSEGKAASERHDAASTGEHGRGGDDDQGTQRPSRRTQQKHPKMYNHVELIKVSTQPHHDAAPTGEYG